MKYTTLLFISLSLLSLSIAATEADEHYEKALSANRKGMVNEALIHIKNALQQDKEHLPARVLLGELYFQKGDLFSTQEVLTDALENGADINLVLFYLGYALLAQEEFEQLFKLEKYEQNLTRANRFEWFLLKAQAYEKQGDNLFAQGFYSDAVKLVPTQKRGLNAFASYLLKQGDVGQSEELIKRSLQLDPNYVKTWSLQAEWYLKQEEIEQGIQALEQAHALDSSDTKVLRLLAFTYMKLGELDKTEKYLAEIEAIYPGDASVTLIKAWLLTNQNKRELAQESLNDLDLRLTLFTEQQVSDNSAIQYLKGSSEFIKGNLEQARKSLETYLASNPGHYSTIQMLTQIYQQLEGDSAAAEFLGSKRYFITGHLPLSIQLVEFYINTDQLFAAREFLSLLQSEHKNNSFVNYISALVERARGIPKSALVYLNGIEEKDRNHFDVLLLKAELLIELDQLDEGKALLLQLQQQEGNEQVINLLGSLALKSNDFASAQDYFEQLLALRADNYLAKYNLAIAMSKQNKVNQAIQQLKQIITAEPEHVPSRVLLARQLSYNGNLAEAEEQAKKLLELQGGYVLGHEILAKLYVTQRKWAQANQSTLALLQENNLNPEYIADHIRALNGLERKSEALRYLNILKGLWSNTWQELTQLSSLYELVGDRNMATSSLNKAIGLKPNTSEPFFYLAQLNLQQGKFEAVAQVIKQLQKQFGQSAQLLVLKGDLALAQNKPKRALKQYQQALKADKNSNLAIIKLYQLAKTGVGANAFSEMMLQRDQQTPLLPWLRKLLADHFLNQGEYERAVVQYEALLAIPSLRSDVSILNNLANLYIDNKLELAYEYAAKAKSLDERNPVVLDTYGWILIKLEQYQEALSVLRSAASMDAQNTEINYHLAVALAKLGRSQDAKFELNKVLEGPKRTFSEDAKTLFDTL